MTSLQEYRLLALMSLWTGLIATLGIVFALIPNVELVILTAFLAGYTLGPRRGLIVAMVGEAIFSALNPVGSGLGFPILFLFQIISVGFAGWTGGLLRSSLPLNGNIFLERVILGLLGFVLTLIYDLLTSLSLPLAAGITEGTIISSMLAGLAFFIMHLVSNTILFALFGPGLIRLIKEHILLHRLELS